MPEVCPVQEAPGFVEFDGKMKSTGHTIFGLKCFLRASEGFD